VDPTPPVEGVVKADLQADRPITRGQTRPEVECCVGQKAHYDAVIIDDLGYVPQGRKETDVLFTFLAERYENKSMVNTSNQTGDQKRH